MSTRIGILGGTFDPIHYAHLFIAEEARVRIGLDQVLFIPNGQPPHKKPYEVTAAVHRLEMTRLAIQGNPAFECSSIEAEREGPSYSVDTLERLHTDHPGAEIYFITGFDAVAELSTWMRHEEVVRLCRFVAVARPGTGAAELERRLPASYLKRIEILESTDLGISSTEIREQVRAGRPIRYLTPDSVVEYIARHGLYKPV